jgi:dephospho-CoA kinase
MLKVGLTGGIGSGKTTIARVFASLGIPVYYADDAAKRLMNADAELKKKIISTFGENIYTQEGLNRKALAAIVFNDREKLELLNALTHPVTIRDAQEWMNRQQAPYIIKEAALLFESGSAENLDLVIGVYAPQHIRVKRVIDRDGVTVDDVMKRISRQVDEEMKMKLCDHVIINNDQKMVLPQVLALHEQFLSGFTS